MQTQQPKIRRRCGHLSSVKGVRLRKLGRTDRGDGPRIPANLQPTQFNFRAVGTILFLPLITPTLSTTSRGTLTAIVRYDASSQDSEVFHAVDSQALTMI